MIQFNLLPQVKLEFIKARRIKRLVVLFSCVAAVVILAVMLNLLLYVNVYQKNHISNLDRQIQSSTTSLKNTTDLSQALTVENQINTIPGLYKNNPVASRLFNYLSEIIPSQASVSSINLNFPTNSVTLSGNANNLITVTGLVDTLKSATYQISSTTPAQNAFSQVVLSSFGYSETGGATYGITADFAPAIFSNTNTVTSLSIPNVVVNRSTSLFEEPSATNAQNSN